MNFIALDVETANADRSSICQIGLAKFKDGQLFDTWSSLIDPRDYFDPFNVTIHGISENDVIGKKSFPDMFPKVSEWLSGRIVVHHGSFDRVAFDRSCARFGLSPIDCSWLNTQSVVRRTFSEFSRAGYNLKNLSHHLGLDLNHHDALSDAVAAGQVLVHCLNESELSLEEWLERIRSPITAPARITGDGNPDGEFYGCNIVFTGTLEIPRREAAEAARRVGFSVKESVSSKITHLCIGIQDSEKLAGYEKSSKHRKAERLVQEGHDIQFLSEADFRAFLKSVGESI